MVSVIIPNYNREKLLPRAVKSVLNQTYKDIELIIVDDASTDNSVLEIKKINDKRMKVIVLEKNSGACVARNKGIDAATGDYIAFLDSDDEWLPEKLELQLDFFKQYHYNACFAQYFFYSIDSHGETIIMPDDLNANKEIYQQLLYKNSVATCTIMVHKNIIRKIRFDVNLPRYQDWDFALQICKSYSVGFLKRPVMNVYEQKNSITNSTSKQKKFKALDYIYNKYKEDIIKNDMAHSHFMWTMGLYYLYINDKDYTYIERSINLDKKNKKKKVAYLILKFGGSGIIKYIYGLHH